MTYIFRQAERKDTALIMKFIKGIAAYEKMLDAVEADEATLEHMLFDEHRAEVIFAMDGEKEVGFALYFYNFSTFVGRSGLYLEDLFVWPEYRGKGYGKALLLELAHIAHQRRCGRMEWVCLNWNEPSIRFYKSLGAVPMDEWTTYRLTEDKIAKLVNQSGDK